MIQIVLNDEQAEILSRAREPVNVVDRLGRDLGKLVPPKSSETELPKSPDPMVVVALQRMEEAESGKGVFYTTAEVLAHLQSMEKS